MPATLPCAPRVTGAGRACARAGNSLNEMQWAGCMLVFAGIIGEQIASFASGGKKKKH